jgi:uncharacterized protein
MKIRLAEIPKEGRSYSFSRESGELDAALQDLVQDHPYQVELFIRPIANAYEMRGTVKTQLTELCALCGWDIQVPIERKVNEILMPEEDEEHRKSQSVHGNHSVDFDNEGIELVSYKGENFDPGAYVHDVVGIAEPVYASCGDNDCERLKEARAIQEALALEFAKAEEKRVGHPAFSVLKGLDKNS